MKRLTLFLFICLLFCTIASAQRIAIKWGEAVSNSGTRFTFLNKDPVSKNSYWLIRKNKKLFLTTTDSNSFKISSKQLLFPVSNGIDLNKIEFSERTYPLKNKAFLLITYQNKKNTKYYIAEIFYDGTIRKPPVLIGETPQENIYTYKNLTISPDSSKILVYFSFDKQKESDKKKYLFKIFTNDFDLVYSKEHESPKTNTAKDDYNNMVLDNQSRISYLEKYKAANGAYTRSVFILNTQTDHIKELTLDSLNNRDIKYSTLFIRNDGLLALSGFYNTKEKTLREVYSGVFYGNIDDDESIKIKTTKIKSVKQPDSIGTIFTSQYPFCITKKDGGIILFSEQIRNNSYYENVLIININAEGDTLYCRTVVRNQKASLFDYVNASHFPFYFEEAKRLFIIYNENKENNVNIKRSIPMLTEIDSVGTIQQKPLMGTAVPSVSLYPLYMQRISENEILIMGSDGTTLREGTMKVFPMDRNIVLVKDSLPAFKKDTSVANKFLPIGVRKIGIGFGNSHYYSGIRLNIIDRNVKTVNGLNIDLVRSRAGTSNGVSIGLLANNDLRNNGISFGLFSNSGFSRNGIVTSLFYSGAKNINGLAISGFYLQGNNIKGIASSILYMRAMKKMSGIALSCIMVQVSGKLNGIALSPFVYTDSTRGISFSLYHFCNNFKGFACSPYGISGVHVQSLKTSKFEGVALSFGFVYFYEIKGLIISSAIISEKQKGVSIGLYNHSKKLKGIQFGLLNYAGNNPRALRYLPIVNMHLGKRDRIF